MIWLLLLLQLFQLSLNIEFNPSITLYSLSDLLICCMYMSNEKNIYWYLLARFVFRSSWLILNLVERLWRKKNHTHIQDLQIPKIRPPLLLHLAFSTYLCRPPLLTLPPEPVQFNHGTNVHISEHEVEIYLVAHKILKLLHKQVYDNINWSNKLTG